MSKNIIIRISLNSIDKNGGQTSLYGVQVDKDGTAVMSEHNETKAMVARVFLPDEKFEEGIMARKEITELAPASGDVLEIRGNIRPLQFCYAQSCPKCSERVFIKRKTPVFVVGNIKKIGHTAVSLNLDALSVRETKTEETEGSEGVTPPASPLGKGKLSRVPPTA